MIDFDILKREIQVEGNVTDGVKQIVENERQVFIQQQGEISASNITRDVSPCGLGLILGKKNQNARVN